MEGERGSTFHGDWTISSHKGRMTCSSFYGTAFSNGPLLGVPSYSVGGGVIESWEIIYLYHEEPVSNFVW